MIQKSILSFPFSGTAYSKNATLYQNPQSAPKACLLYFHGGGLLFGEREDLPNFHLHRLTQAGYAILALDYPLAPSCSIVEIVHDIKLSIEAYLLHRNDLFSKELPFALFGRSAGAYLALLAAKPGFSKELPFAVLAYYGYGFLCNDWFLRPSEYYLQWPTPSNNPFETLEQEICASRPATTHFPLYLYARQSGQWFSLFYPNGREKDFFLHYSLRACPRLSAPLFCTHAGGDPDVPVSEFYELCKKYRAQTYLVNADAHDFDQDENSVFTQELLQKTVHFLNEKAPKHTLA